MKTLELQNQNHPRRPGKIYSLEVHLELVTPQSDTTNVNQDPRQSGIQEAQPIPPGDQLVEVAEDKVMPPQDSNDETSAVLDEVARGSTNLSTVKGMSTIEIGTGAINTAVTFTGTNDFAAICGYVEKLVNIGNIMAEVSVLVRKVEFDRYLKCLASSQVHPWASLAWSILSVIPKVRLHHFVASVVLLTLRFRH